MGLTCTVVAHDHQPLVVRRRVELKVRNDQRRQLLRHLIRNDVCGHELLRLVQLIRVAELYHRLNRFELGLDRRISSLYPSRAHRHTRGKQSVDQ